ncbi:MAG TPA: AI-2E family transporter [Actinomycetota bacterium]|nr:AI-2E family transporter [Actinomycetota bacterium]
MADRERPGDASVAAGDDAMPSWLPKTLKDGRNQLILAIVVGGIALSFMLWLIGRLGNVFTILATALFLSFALEPAVDRLETRGWRRGVATALILVLLIGIGGVLIALIVPAVISGFNQLIVNAPDLIDKLARWLKPLGIDISTDKLIGEVQNNSEQVVKSATALAGGIFGIASSILGGLFHWATVGLFTFYFVAEGPRLRRAVLSRVRPERQQRVLFVWEKAIEQTGGYFYSRLLLAVINGTGMYIVLRLTGVPFAAPLAIFEGIVSEFIPIVGTYIGGALPVLVAFLTNVSAGVWSLGYIVVYQQIENYILSPRLTAKTMDLHPAVAFAAVLIGGALGGVLFAFLSLPVAGVLQAAMREYSKPYEVVDDKRIGEENARERKPGLVQRTRKKPPEGA